jgi:hypothetical protein
MKPVVWCDLDGVLCRFTDAALALHKMNLSPLEIRWDFYNQLGFSGERESLFWEKMGHSFWANIEPHADGFEVFRWLEKTVGQDRIGLLTSPADVDGSISGKIDWVKKHLPAYRKRLMVGSAKNLMAAPNKVLLDDYEGNVRAFREAGGLAVMPPRSWNSRRGECLPCGSFDPTVVIEELREVLNEA